MDDFSHQPSISGDGWYVALTAVDNDGSETLARVIFVARRTGGTPVRADVPAGGAVGPGYSLYPSLSYTGRYVAFQSDKPLVPGDAGHPEDVFVRDREAGRTTKVSVSSAEQPGNGDSYGASISPDGRYVAFTSEAESLVADDTIGKTDVFVRERSDGRTWRASVTSTGGQAFGDSFSPSISRDSRAVAFVSRAANLVPNDTNAVADVLVSERR